MTDNTTTTGIQARTQAGRRVLAGLACAVAVGLTATGCGSAAHSAARTSTPMASMNTPGGMAGMGSMPPGDGLQPSASGFTMTQPVLTPAGGQHTRLTFQITGPNGAAVKEFTPDQTKLLHLYVVRSDLTGFQHLHPSLAKDGTWSIGLGFPVPGSYRVYASFTPKAHSGTPSELVLSRPVTIPGRATATPLPRPAAVTTVDGYTLTISGHPMAGMAHPLTVHVTKDGRPVTDLQPYLESFAHLTAFHTGDLAFAHLHPQGPATGSGGPDLSFDAMLPDSGDYRMFIQFQTDGVLHTAAITLRVG